MELIIKETAWGINRMTGSRSEKVTAKKSFPCEIGEIPVFGKGGRRFSIDHVSEEGITVTVHCADERYNKTWEIQKGEELAYRPRSFDGGYFYTLKLV